MMPVPVCDGKFVKRDPGWQRNGSSVSSLALGVSCASGLGLSVLVVPGI